MPFPVDNIRAACKDKGITLAQLERMTGIGNGVIARWEYSKGTPPIDRLQKIADTLEVSIDYLSTGRKKPTPTNEDGLAERINRLTPENRQKLEQYMTDLLQYQETQERLDLLLKSQGKQ